MPEFPSADRPGTTPAYRVRPAAHPDVTAMAPVLARAFTDDPVWCHLTPQRSRQQALQGAFAAFLRRLYLRHDGIEIAGRSPASGAAGRPLDGSAQLPAADSLGEAPIEAVAIWDPPGRWKTPLTTQALLAPAVLLNMRGRTPHLLLTLAAIEKVHPLQPHWYLAILGTEPAAQGHGLGAALLTSGLHRCDAAHLPAYLESSKERNVPFYERFGFKVTRELRLPLGGPSVWTMWRDPC